MEKNIEDKPIIPSITGVFLVKKLGKKGFSAKERILVVNELTVTYYTIPTPNIKTQTFFDSFNKFYKKKTGGNIKVEEDERHFGIFCKEFDKIKEEFFKHYKDEIPYEFHETINEVEHKDNQKNFKYPVIIKQKLSDEKNKTNPAFYSKLQTGKGLGDKQKSKLTDKKEFWVLEFYDASYFDRYKRIVDEIRRKKTSVNLKETNAVIKAPEVIPKAKLIKKDEEKKEEKKKEENTIDADPDIFNMIHYNEICFQYLLKQYYSIPPNNSEFMKMKYEFAILQLTTKFKEICQMMVKKIIHDLSAKVFQPSGSSFAFFPMMFPVPKSLKKPEQAVFLYYIVGINFTLTWVCIVLYNLIASNLFQNAKRRRKI